MEDRDAPGGLAVFAYGSLVLPESAAATLGRPVPALEPATLPGWRRRWSQYRDNRSVEKTFARAQGGELPPFILGLNLERAGEGDVAPNGALLPLSEQELQRLDLRELRYDRVEVSAEIDGHRFDPVFAYTAKKAHFARQAPAGAVVIAGYIRALERAFSELGRGEWERFHETTGPPPVEAIEAVLVHDQIPPGNPRQW
jgi:cation transport regulator ChaC